MCIRDRIEVLEEAPSGHLDGEMVPPADPTEIVNLSQGKSYTIRREENTNYPDTNGTELTDGVLGSESFNDPAWSGCSYGGTTSGKVYDRWPLRSVIIDLGGTKSVTQIKANFLTDSSKGIYQPQSIRTFASMDGENWKPLSRLNNINTYATGIQTYGWHVNGENGVAVDLTGDENSIVLANYIRFDLEKFSWNLMDEVTVMGYDGFHSEALPVTNTTMPVSYTHLDVYKRQNRHFLYLRLQPHTGAADSGNRAVRGRSHRGGQTANTGGNPR